MKKVVVLLTTCLLMLCTILSVAAQSSTRAAKYDDLDYSDGSHGTVTMHMGDVLGFLGGYTVTEAEKNYIRVNYDGECKLYYSRPSVYDLQHTYDGKNRRLTIVVMDDLHTGKYADLIWVPMRAMVGESTATFEPAPEMGSNYYRAVLDNVQWSESLAIDIEYGADIVVTAATLNDFINYAFESAGKLYADKAAYDLAYELYQKSVAEWEQYEKDAADYELYLDRVALYQDYLLYQAYKAELDAYNLIHEAFLANQQEWNKYYGDQIKYQAYLDYKNYQYPGLVADYQAQWKDVEHQLHMLSLLEKEDPKTEMSFAEMMMDDRIAKKIEKHKTTVSMATSASTVDAIIAATYDLQDFFEVFTTLETDQEKYEYYIANHKTFARNLNKLYTGIQEVYESDIVYDEMCAEYPDYVTDMVRMMGSLYVQNCVFNDNLQLNLNQIVDVRGKQKASVLVDPSVRPATNGEDTNKATPLAAWPVEPADPESFEVREAPVEPGETLEDGVAPEKPVYGVIKNEAELEQDMQDPGYMEQPVEPAPKPANPVKLNWSASQQALYDVYADGQLVYREPFVEDQAMTIRENATATIYMDPSDIRYTVYFYNTDEHSTYLGRADDIREGQAAIIPPSAQHPTKPADAQYTYEFIGWVDAQGNPVDLTCITKDLTVYANYKAILRSYTVTWMVEGVPTVQTVLYGELPVFEGTPQKAADAQYYYTFDTWDKEVIPVNGDVTYTARFDSHLQKYSVTFHMGNGETVVKEFLYGQSLSEVVGTMRTPYQEPTAQYSYTFKGWRDAKGTFYADKSQLPALTENMTFTAEFDASLNSYTVTWVVNGNETKGVWEYGTVPSYGADPFKETDARFYYHFDGWDKEVVAVTQDVTYTAQFREELRYYTITFVVDGVEHKADFAYEQLPWFDGSTDKQSDVQYHYTFTGWDHEIEEVRGNATYVAQYSTTLRKYTVKFIVEGVETTAEFDYGTLPSFTGDTPAKADDDTYVYVFTGWDKEIVAVDGSEAVYTAVFEALPLAPTGDGGFAKLVDLGNGNYLLEIGCNSVNLTRVFEKLGRLQANSLTVDFGDVILVFPKEQIDAFYLMGDGIADVIVDKVMHQGLTAYAIQLLDANDAPATLVTELIVKILYNGPYTADVCYLEEDGTLTNLEITREDTRLVFSTMDFSTFVIKEKFTLTVTPSENGTVTVPQEAYCGDTITFTPDAADGYFVDGVKVLCNGEEVAVTMSNGVYSFVMPNGNVEITATFAEVESGSMTEVIVGVLTAVLIVAIGLVIVIIISKKKAARV